MTGAPSPRDNVVFLLDDNQCQEEDNVYGVFDPHPRMQPPPPPPLRLLVLFTVTDTFLMGLVPILPVSSRLLKGCLRFLLCAASHPVKEMNVKLSLAPFSDISSAVMSKCLYFHFSCQDSSRLFVCLLFYFFYLLCESGMARTGTGWDWLRGTFYSLS